MTHATRKLALLFAPLLLLRAPYLFAEPSPAAVAAFNTYAHTVESRLAQQHSSPNTFLVLPTDPAQLARLRSGQLIIEPVTTPAAPDALLHHWRATAFVPNATPADFARLLQNFSAYPHNFAPQIVSTTVLSRTPTDTIARLRTRQHHIITVVLDTTVDVTFASLDPAHGYSISRSRNIDQVSPSGDDGFLYRLNTYWSYEQRDGGLYLQIESLSLTRSIPHGLAWAVQPYLESIPRESLVFTLTSARNALRDSKTDNWKLATGN
jgi:ribosome-associated toxin RatA of RatAB toxin-antitoxin module